MIGKLGEVILYVEDMAKQVAFYRDVLGFRVIDPADTNPCDAFWVLFDTGSCQLALHGGGERRFGEDAPKFVFMVDDIQAARAELLAKGVAAGDVFSPVPNVSVVNCTDPEGNRFSLEMRREG
jgi:catechol 2,3-dioxygenase-like lactoylglutathione lyase family enzyme